MGYIPTMPYARIIPAVILAFLVPLFSQGQAPAPVPEGPTQAEVQLDTATIKVRLMKQIAASIEQDVDMLNQKFKLEGNYYKDFTNDFKVRLQLKLVNLGDTDSTMLQVCDGKVLWDFQKVLKMQTFRKKDILPILQKLDEAEVDPFFRSLVMSQLGFGGPEAMLTGLRRAVKFDQILPTTLDGVEVWDIGGTWVDREMLRVGERPLPATVPLPPYIPSTIHVFVGKENGWPYKIVMTGNTPSKLIEDTRPLDPISGRPVGVKKAPPKVDPTQITLLYKLLPLTEINSGLFVFNTPADVASGSVDDQTKPFLDTLSKAIAMESARKKADAAKAAEEPLLKGTIEVGRPRDPGTPDTFPTTPTPAPTPTPPATPTPK